ncbi:hypothetical protein B0T25DRAFT_447371 [Lasiosphaeria hispida]|uniref:AB hydrolase-1 domain-containing protein n=1 Tax=Lasiosphaeria hispida TaxID=260671 RepID=A0AAJ0HP80_9PEZI|nr:hypothetical protein B0T25DRAFT_447371 [Lasiosphaeria hispida]
MKNILHFASLGPLALLPTVTGTPTKSPQTNFKQCVQLEVPVPVIAQNHHYDMPRIDSTTDAVHWTLNTTAWSTPNATERITGIVPVKQTFRIHAQLCVPTKRGPRADILQIATQGRGFDKRYWEVEIRPEEYSYLDAAISKGYSVLTYDRIGTGESELPDAYDIGQIPAQAEILAGLTTLARSGKLVSSSQILPATTGIPLPSPFEFQPSKIIHVGHSLGSFITFSFLSSHGALSDGALLTGFLLNKQLGTIAVSHFDHEFAAQHDPSRFAAYPSGYIVLTGQSDIQKLFFRKDGFEPALLEYAEKIKQPEAVGEYPSSDSAAFVPASEFKGPVLFMAGEYDYALCGGDCRGQYMEEESRGLFPASPKVEAYLQPGTGHALTLAGNATGGFGVMLGWLGDRGL